jgi:hypothetical protein
LIPVRLSSLPSLVASGHGIGAADGGRQPGAITANEIGQQDGSRDCPLPADFHWTGQGRRAWERGAGQVILDRNAAGDPRIRGPAFDHHPPAVSEFGGGDLGQMPAAEQLARRPGAEITVTPVGGRGR